MLDYRGYTDAFCREHGYPDEAREALLAAHDELFARRDEAVTFFDAVKKYVSGTLPDFDAVFAAMTAFAKGSAISEYTFDLEFLICMSMHLRDRYKLMRIDEKIFHDTMHDTYAKLLECRAVKGVWGNFVGFWYPGFFDMTRFALGRLQFETAPFKYNITLAGKTLRPGDTVISLHIPSLGPLRREEYLESYRRACEFFAPLFEDGITPFYCSSWLLHPSTLEVYPSGANTPGFVSDFTLIEGTVRESRSNLWRVFGAAAEDGRPDSELPEDTSLRRALKARLLRGEPIGSAVGVQLWQNGKRIEI